MTTTPSVVYVIGEHPRISQTFVQAEIAALEAIGVHVDRFSLRRPRTPDPGREQDPDPERERERDRTAYVEPTARRALRGAAAVARRPALVGVLGRSLTGTTGAPRAVAVTVARFVSAVSVWRSAVATGSPHVHAQFAGGPAEVACLVAAISRAAGRGPRTWSFTNHGPHEYVGGEELRIGTRVADASLVIAVSNFTRAQLMRLSDPRHWDRIVVRRCGVDLDRLARLARPAGTDHSARLPPSGAADRLPRIVTVSRLSSEKGIPVLLDAAALLHRQGLAHRLVLVGDGPERERLRERAEQLGIADHVDFRGEVAPDAVPAELAGADVFCLASFSEGIPVSVMEAMALGVPVVASAVGGVREIADDGRTARLVSPGEPAELAEALAATLRLSSPDRARQIDAARSKVAAEYDLAVNGPAVAATLAALCGAATT